MTQDLQNFILLLISLFFGAFVGHAAWLSYREKNLGAIGNIVTGMIGGLLGWLLLEWMGWYVGEWNLGFKVSAIFGYAIMSSVTSGLLLLIATFIKTLLNF